MREYAVQYIDPLFRRRPEPPKAKEQEYQEQPSEKQEQQDKGKDSDDGSDDADGSDKPDPSDGKPESDSERAGEESKPRSVPKSEREERDGNEELRAYAVSKDRIIHPFHMAEVNAITSEVPAGGMGHAASHGNDAHYQEWSGSESFAAARKLSISGWKDGADRCEEMAQKFIAENQIEARKLVHYQDVSGGSVDIGAYLSGEPECMHEYRIETRRDRIVTILSDCTTSSQVSAETMQTRGEAVYTAVRALQLSGYSVGVWLAFAIGEIGGSQIVHQFQVEIKPHNFQLDPAVVAFYLGHPSSFRRIMFRMIEEQPMALREKLNASRRNGLYGYCRQVATTGLPENCIIIGPHDRDLELVLNKISAAGIELRNQQLAA